MGLLDFLFGDSDTCSSCKGTGTVDRGIRTETCDHCGGSGKESDGWSPYLDSEGGRKSWKEVEDKWHDDQKYW